MTISRAWAIGIGVVLGLAIVLGGFEWLQAHDALLKAETQTGAQQKTIDQAKADEATIQRALATQLQTLEAQRKQPATAPQIVIDAAKMFPNLPAQLQVVTPPPTTQTVNGKTVEVPSAPVVQIPQVDFAAMQDGIITCQENSAKLDACNLTEADTKVELKTAEAQRDEWEKTAKGGNWLHRTWGVVKWAAPIGAAAYAAGRLAK